jgi:hypothetical protein
MVSDYLLREFVARSRVMMMFRIISVLLVAIAASAGAAAAQAPVPAATQPDRSIHITVDGVQILQKGANAGLRSRRPQANVSKG